jgi:hypothetical protein
MQFPAMATLSPFSSQADYGQPVDPPVDLWIGKPPASFKASMWKLWHLLVLTQVQPMSRQPPKCQFGHLRQDTILGGLLLSRATGANLMGQHLSSLNGRDGVSLSHIFKTST